MLSNVEFHAVAIPLGDSTLPLRSLNSGNLRIMFKFDRRRHLSRPAVTVTGLIRSSTPTDGGESEMNDRIAYAEVGKESRRRMCNLFPQW